MLFLRIFYSPQPPTRLLDWELFRGSQFHSLCISTFSFMQEGHNWSLTVVTGMSSESLMMFISQPASLSTDTDREWTREGAPSPLSQSREPLLCGPFQSLENSDMTDIGANIFLLLLGRGSRQFCIFIDTLREICIQLRSLISFKSIKYPQSQFLKNLRSKKKHIF